jgi:hypothetical protein
LVQLQVWIHLNQGWLNVCQGTASAQGQVWNYLQGVASAQGEAWNYRQRAASAQGEVWNYRQVSLEY